MCDKLSQKIFGVHLKNNNMSRQIKLNRPHKGYLFEYITTEEFNKRKEESPELCFGDSFYYRELKLKKKIETSKKILAVSYALAIILTVIVVICTFANIECGYITTLASAAWLEVSASNVFYYTMCKRLNIPKVVMGIYGDLPSELKEQVDINNLISNLMN